MTTIVCTSDMMVADSCVVQDQLGTYPTSKLRRIGDSIFACCGESSGHWDLLQDWIENGRKLKDRPKPDPDDDYFIIELSPKGIYIANQVGKFDKVNRKTFTAGSGRKVASYCMEKLGMDAFKAALEACEYDKPWSAPPLHWMKLDGTEGTVEG
jgi:hypothetical protein